MKEQTSRERVLRTFRFEETDRAPFDLMESIVWPELQKWFYFLCHIVREHAQIWQIHLVVSKSILARLRPSQDKLDVFVEVVDEEK